MSLNQVIKIPSEQSSFDRSGKKNNVDFILPAGSVYDLSRTYVAVSIDARVLNGNSDEVLGRSVLHLGSGVDGQADTDTLSQRAQFLPSQVSLVQNAHMSSQNRGKISDIRRVNKYAFTKAYYKKSTEDLRNDVGALAPKQAEDLTVGGTSLEFNTFGDEISRYRTHDVRIPLSEIFPFARNESYDGNKHGDTRIHLEMPFQLLTNTPITLDGTQFAPINMASSDMATGQILMGTIDDLTVDITNPDSMNTVVTNAKYGTRNVQPFFVGEAIDITGNYTPAGGAAGGTGSMKHTITKLTHNPNGSISIQLNSALAPALESPLSTNGSFTGLQINDQVFKAGGHKADITNIELITEIVNSPAPSGMVTYETILSEEDSFAAATTHSKVYSIPPMCKNFYVMFFKGNGIASDDGNLSTYRVTIDDVEMSQSAVTVGSAEHYDNLMRTFMNAGESLNNIVEKYYQIQTTTTTNPTPNNRSGSGRNMMISYPTPFLNRPQKLQLELASSGGNLSTRLIVYYDIVKQI